MDESLLSLGVDVGTTTTQFLLSRLGVENRASAFAVPELAITRRKVLHKSPVHFTPLTGDLVDGGAIAALLDGFYAQTGVDRSQVDTGAIIITGETSRRENARRVLASLSAHAGQFVVATAGPDLESVLAARGAGAVEYSRERGCRVLHMDIGGGTTNLALAEDGKILATACMNVGGRLVKLDAGGRLTYVSPVLAGMGLAVGQVLTQNAAWNLARQLGSLLEMAAGLREKDGAFARFTTEGTRPIVDCAGAVLSFSGGVADCIRRREPWLAYGDLGPLLGQAIRDSALCAGEYRLPADAIRATVIGAGCHSTQLSGSTVFCRGVDLPLQNLPVAAVPGTPDAEKMARALEGLEQWGFLALPDLAPGTYRQVGDLADQIARAVGSRPCYVVLRADMAQALGTALALRLPPQVPCLCLDRLQLGENCYLDVGSPLGPAFPVVIKTLVFSNEGGAI